MARWTYKPLSEADADGVKLSPADAALYKTNSKDVANTRRRVDLVKDRWAQGNLEVVARALVQGVRVPEPGAPLHAGVT